MSTATTDRRLQRIRAAIRARGLRLEPIGESTAVRIVGPGVHVVAASLADISAHDLTPANPQDDNRHETPFER